MSKKNSNKGDSILAEVRRVREMVSKKYSGNHIQLSKDARKIAKECGMKYATIKPVGLSLKEITKKRKKEPAA